MSIVYLSISELGKRSLVSQPHLPRLKYLGVYSTSWLFCTNADWDIRLVGNLLWNCRICRSYLVVNRKLSSLDCQ